LTIKESIKIHKFNEDLFEVEKNGCTRVVHITGGNPSTA
jgi:hypothetical protein